jgi:hypothetical protein
LKILKFAAVMALIWQAAAMRRLFGKPFGEFEEDTPVGRILDFPECNDEPQTLDDTQIDLIIANQP